MSDLIPRDAAMDVIKTWGRQINENARMALLLHDMQALEPVDAAPVVHSTYHLHHREDFSAPPCECNNCHCEFTVDDVKEDCHYCPKCGAKLDGEEPACGPDYCEIGGE